MPHPHSDAWTQVPDLNLYDGILREIDRFFATDDYSAALELLETTWPGLPDAAPDVRLVEILVFKAYCLARLKRPAEALGVFRSMLRCGLSCSLSSPAYDEVRALSEYAAFARENAALLDRDQRRAKVEMDVEAPVNLPRGATAPAFLILHGEPGNLVRTHDVWPTDAIVGRGVIAAYVQSSQVRSAGRYMWSPDPARARADVQEAVRGLCRRYPIDTSRLILGGFSAGATAALDALLGEKVPGCGFICLCAGDRPESLTPGSLRSARERGVRGVFFEGERNWPDEEEQAMLEAMNAAELPVELVLNPGCAHEAPADFALRIEQALDFVLGAPKA